VGNRPRSRPGGARGPTRRLVIPGFPLGMARLGRIRPDPRRAPRRVLVTAHRGDRSGRGARRERARVPMAGRHDSSLRRLSAVGQPRVLPRALDVLRAAVRHSRRRLPPHRLRAARDRRAGDLGFTRARLPEPLPLASRQLADRVSAVAPDRRADRTVRPELRHGLGGRRRRPDARRGRSLRGLLLWSPRRSRLPASSSSGSFGSTRSIVP
jgi:hypothetical protein